MSDERLLGELVATVKLTREDVIELKADVKKLTHWKLKVMGGASVVSAIVAMLIHFLK